ncbi:MAG TPA: condensation domain-containing protein, partial [Bacillota bacterium]|nr:condensation domain-containing protein [Bacillota bacterium]
WQNRRLDSGKIREQEDDWRNMLSGELPVLAMPLDFPRPARRSFAGNKLEFSIPQDLSRKLAGMAQQRNCTLNTLLFSIYSLLLNQYSGQDDLIKPFLVQPAFDD